MSDGVLFRVVTAYTMTQYKEYNRTVQRSNGVYRRSWATLAVYAVIGLLLAIALDAWYVFPVFVVIGLAAVYSVRVNLRKAEDAQYQQEQLVGAITYEFREDRLDMTSAVGTASYDYASVVKVMENDSAFYIMNTQTTGAILPKEDCSAELDEFIRTKFTVVKVPNALRRRYPQYKIYLLNDTPSHMESEEVERMALIGQALSDPNRLRILLNFKGRSLSISDMTEELGSYQSSVSYHISILHKAGLIRRTDNGRWHYYQLEDGTTEFIKAFLAECSGRGRKKRKV